MTRMVVRCPAKVNLHLEVFGLRPDGYHEVRTLLAAVGLWDELEVEAAPPGVWELRVEGGVSLPADNTVWRAAKLLLSAFPDAGGARVVLRKGIPAAAGLGGGSADGAAALVALAKLWGLPVEPGQLVAMASEIGSDVPFFLFGGACWATGRGEQVLPLPDLPRYGVVVIPGQEPVSTPAVYRAWDEAQQESALPSFEPAPGLPRPGAGWHEGEGFFLYDWLVGKGELPFAKLRNDLQAAAIALFPWIGENLALLARFSPLTAMVSGSGGTVFGLFRDEGEAVRVAAELSPRQAVAVPLLRREESQLLAHAE